MDQTDEIYLGSHNPALFRGRASFRDSDSPDIQIPHDPSSKG
jgi:hypothetical protein